MVRAAARRNARAIRMGHTRLEVAAQHDDLGQAHARGGQHEGEALSHGPGRWANLLFIIASSS
ncbi:MAG TPA: hypothetical protein VK898_14985, partial [Chloroflexota bacterium]|nr:hypothetical protein [Chloroflexota bacterium]